MIITINMMSLVSRSLIIVYIVIITAMVISSSTSPLLNNRYAAVNAALFDEILALSEDEQLSSSSSPSSSSGSALTSFVIAPSFKHRHSITTSRILDDLYELLGPELCFSERGPLSMLQLCLEHGFRRLEVERSSPSSRESTSTSKSLQEELENLFSAAATAPFAHDDDGVFSSSSSSSSKSAPPPAAVVVGDVRFASPLRADRPRRDPSALANLTMEIYGRFIPGVSNLELDHRRGFASMMLPNGDPCFHHHEHDEMPWTTHVRFLCSFSVDRSVSQALSLGASSSIFNFAGKSNNNNNNKPIRWDVRVNAPQCIVTVFVSLPLTC